MAARFIIEREASLTRPDWDGWALCLQWGALTDDEGRITEHGYRNIWRNPSGRLFTGRAQTRIPSRALSDELWGIAERDGWSHFLGDMADQWQRVMIDMSDDVVAAANATSLMQGFSKALLAAGCPPEAEVFSNNVPGQNTSTARIYFFSPKAAQIAEDILQKFDPVACQQPDFGGVRKLRL